MHHHIKFNYSLSIFICHPVNKTSQENFYLSILLMKIPCLVVQSDESRNGDDENEDDEEDIFVTDNESKSILLQNGKQN